MSRKSVILVLLGAAVCVMAAVILLPIYIRAHTIPSRNPCINNLRFIDGAKQQWALEYIKTTNDIPTMEDLRPWIERGPKGEVPVCPNGGKYTLGRIGEPPSCSIHGSLE